MKHTTLSMAMLLALSAGLAVSCRSSDDLTDEAHLTAFGGNLQTTDITPHLEAPLVPGRSVLWCGTFQLAWNQACTLLGEDLHFAEDPPMVAALNRKAFTADDLDAASSIAVANFTRDNGVFRDIDEAFKSHFGGRITPHHLPNPSLANRPQDIVAYAYLFKHIEWTTPMVRSTEPLSFLGTPVSAFGVEPGAPQSHAMLAQVSVLDYQDDDHFIIALKTRSDGDQVILAKVPAGATLAATVNDVLERMAKATPTPAESNDTLQIPRFDFDLTCDYDALLDRDLVVKNPAVAKNTRFLVAMQNTRFRMDEGGVILRSESELTTPAADRMLVFDKPFLILLKRAEASVPYFALWVGSAELLVPADRP